MPQLWYRIDRSFLRSVGVHCSPADDGEPGGGAFLLLPLFAIRHKTVDFGQKRYYIDYLVFSLNFHAFAVFLITIGRLMGLISSCFKTPPEFMAALIPIYRWIAFKIINQQGWVKGSLKVFIAFGLYGVLLVFLVVFFAAVLLI